MTHISLEKGNIFLFAAQDVFFKIGPAIKAIVKSSTLDSTATAVAVARSDGENHSSQSIVTDAMAGGPAAAFRISDTVSACEPAPGPRQAGRSNADAAVSAMPVKIAPRRPAGARRIAHAYGNDVA